MVLIINGDNIWELGYRGSYGYLVAEHSDKAPWYPSVAISDLSLKDKLINLCELIENRTKCKDCIAISEETIKIPLTEKSSREEIIRSIERGEIGGFKILQVYVSYKLLDSLGIKYVDDFGSALLILLRFG